jgi:2'-5' RNA ligase
MRTFIAIELPLAWQNLISTIQKSIQTEEAIRWVKPDCAHLTLKFLGDVSSEQADLVQKELNKLCLCSFILEMDSLGAFPSLQKPEIIWLGLKDSPLLFQLSDEIETALSSLGFPKETRPFKAHITIGRIKGKANQPLKNALAALKVPALSHPIKQITFIQSTLTSDGSVYQILSHHPLKDL